MTGRALFEHARAQARLPLVLAGGYDGRILGRAARVVGGAVREQEGLEGGVPALVYRPGRGSGPWPAVVVFPGVTRRGRLHPGFRAIGRGLATAGYLVVVSEPDGLAVGELAPATLLQARAAAEATAGRPDTLHGRIALVGVSGGATLSLLLAADPGLADRVSAVAALAPCCDIAEGLRVATTGVHRDGDRLVPFATGDFFRLVLARSVVAWLPPGPDRSALRTHLRELEDYGPEPLAGLRAWPREELGDAARAVVELLSNEGPDRFDELLAAFPDELRDHVRTLSPVSTALGVSAPVELVVPRSDKYVPPADSASFAAVCPTARLTVLGSLAHAVPAASITDLRGIAQLNAILVRLLAASYSRR